MNLSVTRSSLAPAVALLTALALGACAEGQDDDPESKSSSATTSDATTDPSGEGSGEGSEVPGDGLGAAEESLDDAVARIEEALASDDCDDIAALGWGGDLSPQDVADRCTLLEKRFGTDGPSQVVAMGSAGGVLEFEPPDREATRAVLVADEDGLLRPIFFDYVSRDADDIADGGNPKQFTKAAEKALTAMGKGDCDALAAVSHHDRTRDWVCSVAEGSLAQALERADRRLEPLGVSSDYALYGIQGLNVHWLLVMARQPKAVKSAAKGYPDKKKAPTHVLASVVRVAD